MIELPRLSVYVDGRNIWHGCQAIDVDGYLDFWALAGNLVTDAIVRHVNYYDCPIDQKKDPHNYSDQRRFLAHLRARPDSSVRLGYLGRRGGSLVLKGVDTKLTTDVIVDAHNNVYDVALVVSGDGDFADPMYAVRSLGKRILCCYVKRPGRRVVAPLHDAADNVYLLDAETVKRCLWVPTST